MLIAPILVRYEAKGTGVFDASGGAALRKLEAPDEILMFCVDCSASMRTKSDFAEANGDDASEGRENPLQPTIEGEYFARARYEDVTEGLCKHEKFDDMIAIAADAREAERSTAARYALTILGNIMATQLSSKLKELDRTRQIAGGFFARRALAGLEAPVNEQKGFHAGLRTHEQGLIAFLIYRAQAATFRTTSWTWSPGDAVPASSTGSRNIPLLRAELTEIPDELLCPISQGLLLNQSKLPMATRTLVALWNDVYHPEVLPTPWDTTFRHKYGRTGRAGPVCS